MVEILQFATDLGVNLLPWQETLFDRSLRMNEHDRYVHRSCLAITARQSGKTRASGLRALAELVLWGGRLVCMAAQSRDVALESFRGTVDLAEEGGVPIKAVRRSTGSEELIIDDIGSPRLKVVSSTSGGGRGLSPSVVIWDELQSTKNFEPYAALEKSRRAQPNSQLFAITSEGTFESAVLNSMQEQGRAAALEGRSDGVGYWEWSAHPDRAADDRAGWVEANPALGHLIDEETIAAEHATDPAEVFERETLCRRTTVARSWLPAGAWDRCTDPAATVPDSAVHEVVFGLDANPDLSHASISVAWRRPDGRTHVELVSSHDSTWSAETALRGLLERWQPRCLALIGKGPAEPVGARLGAEGVELCALSGADVDRAARSFYEAASAGRLTHPADPVLAVHLEAAQGSSPGLLAIKGTPIGLDITGAVAAVVAVWALERTPVVTVPTWVAW